MTQMNHKPKISTLEYFHAENLFCIFFSRNFSSKMSNSSNNKDGDSDDDRGLTLVNVFFIKRKTLRNKIVRNIAYFASVPLMFRVLLTCKEMLAAEEEIFDGYRLPKVCNMIGGIGLKMYRLMVRTVDSRWLVWFATSKVQELMLPKSITDDEMLRMFGGGMRFFELCTLNLTGCSNITGTTVAEVARECLNLRSLNLTGCSNINDADLGEVTRRCSNLQSLNLTDCKITDTGLSKVARRCSNIQSLNLSRCRITDTGLSEVARQCSNLQSLNISVSHTSPNRITDTSVLEVARGCSNLQTLNLGWCRNITNTSLAEVGRQCSKLQSLDLTGCSNITDASVLEVARRCSNLRSLNLQRCDNITDACKNALRQSHSQLSLLVSMVHHNLN